MKQQVTIYEFVVMFRLILKITRYYDEKLSFTGIIDEMNGIQVDFGWKVMVQWK